MPHHTVTVTDDNEGIRLDRFLASVLPSHSPSQIHRLIKEGLILDAGRETKANQPV
jgi:23S rRNA-/tRNA-specific pseudouridylate synthase